MLLNCHFQQQNPSNSDLKLGETFKREKSYIFCGGLLLEGAGPQLVVAFQNKNIFITIKKPVIILVLPLSLYRGLFFRPHISLLPREQPRVMQETVHSSPHSVLLLTVFLALHFFLSLCDKRGFLQLIL